LTNQTPATACSADPAGRHITRSGWFYQGLGTEQTLFGRSGDHPIHPIRVATTYGCDREGVDRRHRLVPQLPCEE
jgi:hypothetical protein